MFLSTSLRKNQKGKTVAKGKKAFITFLVLFFFGNAVVVFANGTHTSSEDTSAAETTSPRPDSHRRAGYLLITGAFLLVSLLYFSARSQRVSEPVLKVKVHGHTNLPRIFRTDAPVADGRFPAFPWSVSFAKIANAIASFASAEMPEVSTGSTAVFGNCSPSRRMIV